MKLLQVIKSCGLVVTSVVVESMNSKGVGTFSKLMGVQSKLVVVVFKIKLNRMVESARSSPDKSPSYHENVSNP